MALDWEQEWDFAEEFTPQQIAMLITGRNPGSLQIDSVKRAIQENPVFIRVVESIILHSESTARKQPAPPQSLKSRGYADYVSRAEVVRWLAATGLKSVYQFDLEQKNIQQAEQRGSDTTQEKPMKTTERNTLLKLVIGMAIDGYRYDPTATKSPIPKEIESALLLLGMSVTDETVLKYLKLATDTVLPKKTPQP